MDCASWPAKIRWLMVPMDCASWPAKIMLLMETNGLHFIACLDNVAYGNKWTVHLGPLR